MNVCVIGSLPRIINSTGLQSFNQFLIEQLKGMGHQVDVFVPMKRGIFALQSLGQITIPGVKISNIYDIESRSSRIIEPMRDAALTLTLSPYDKVIISDVALDFGMIARAAGNGKAVVWTHGMQCSPLAIWDGAELKSHAARYACISKWHLDEAVRMGFEEQSTVIDIPVPFEAQEVSPAGGRCVAVSSLDARKCYYDIAEIAEALQQKVDVYGEVQSAEVLRLVESSQWLEYKGRISHYQLLKEVKDADFMLHAARVEGFPVSVREANGLGVPVITWDIELYKDNGVTPERNVLLPLRGDIAAALTAADMKALRSIKNRRALAARTHEQYGPAAFDAKLSALLKEE